MRRALLAAALLIVATAGCAAQGRPALVAPTPGGSGRFSREAVPDSVMIPDRASAPYHDGPGS